jgi:hypothetical protein
MEPKKKLPVNLAVNIEPASLKKIVESGRLAEFVDAFSTLAAAHIQAEIINHVATGSIGGISIARGFDDEPGYGNGPRHWPFPKGIFEDVLRERAKVDAVRVIEQAAKTAA